MRLKPQERRDKRANRYAEYGRAQERWVEQILRDSKEFDEVILHAPNSEADNTGKDFTVRRGEQSVSFGMTISLQSWHRSKVLYRDVAQFCFPLNVRPETVLSRVRELFEQESDD